MNKAHISKLNHQYHNTKEDVTPFEVYLKYSNEKETSIKQLSKILSNLNPKKILDVGCGDGTYLLNSLSNNKDIDITLLEPSKDLYSKLKENTKHTRYKCINQTFEQFYENNEQAFDLVLASHLYHFTQEEYNILISQLTSLLEDKGTLIWIERGIDDITDFKKKFKTKLLPNRYPNNWEPRNYEKALGILKEKSSDTHLVLNNSVLEFPYKENLDDVIAIVEFYLNIDWSSIPKDIQEEILSYISSKKGIFNQGEGIVIYTKT